MADRSARDPAACFVALARTNCYWSGGNDPPAGEVDLTKLWAVLPRISHVFVAARNLTLGDMRSETLTELELELDGEVMVRGLEPLLAGSAPNLRELHDVGDTIRIAIENAPITLPPTRLHLPFADASAKHRIHMRYPFATFSTFATEVDGDRYEQTGE